MKPADLTMGAVILAAGSASRFGALKQVIAIDGEPMVRRIARNALAAQLHPVVVVVGAQGDRVIECLNNLDVLPIENAEWSTGMGRSLAEGVKALLAQASALRSLMVLLADQPSIRVGDLENMIAAHRRSPARILASGSADVFGPPCIFPIGFAHELSTLEGSRGARDLLEKYGTQVDIFDLPSALLDIDHPDDYSRWQDSENGPPSGKGSY